MEISPAIIKIILISVFVVAAVLITVYVKKFSSRHIIIKNKTRREIEVWNGDELAVKVKPAAFRSVLVNYLKPDTVKVIVHLENGNESVFSRTFEHLRNSRVVTQWTVFESPANVYRDHLGSVGSMEATCGE